MEIKTCEQYVLAQLREQQDENDRLCAELRRRDERIEELEASLAAFHSPVQEAVIKAGRQKLMANCCGYYFSAKDVSGEILPFMDWAYKYVQVNNCIGCFTRMEFITEFETELRDIYEEMLARKYADE